MATPLNYATEYSQQLAQAFPYVLYFGALYATPNNGRYKVTGAKTIEIPRITTTGRTDGDRDSITGISRNFSNDWETKVLVNHRKWDTLVHPVDIIQTNHVTSISNITQVYNEEQKFPEMDAYLVSKVHTDWATLGKTADTTVLTADNVLPTFDKLMQKMTEARVPISGRILYVTPATQTLISNAKEIAKYRSVQQGGTAIERGVSSIDLVKIESVPSELMKTVYNFTKGWAPGAGAKQLNMFLVHPLAVITPVVYSFAQLDPPSAMSQGKWAYYEESFEDAFILERKADAIQYNMEA